GRRAARDPHPAQDGLPGPGWPVASRPLPAARRRARARPAGARAQTLRPGRAAPARRGAPKRRRRARRPSVAPHQPRALAGHVPRRRGRRRCAPGSGTVMRLVWVKVGGLWPVNTGGRIRSFHMLRELSRRHHVTLLTTHAPSEDTGALEAALPQCEVVSVPWALAKRGSARFALALVGSWLSSLPVDLYKARVPALGRELARRLEGGGVDLVVADFLLAAPNVARAATPPTVLFAHNVEHVIWQRMREVERRAWRRALLALESRKMRRYEALACARARLKIFEALAMAKAVVSTAIGAEGLPLTPGRDFLQADDPAAFARAVTSLLRDPARRRAVGSAGRRLVEERYSWPRVVDEFENQCEEARRHAS